MMLSKKLLGSGMAVALGLLVMTATNASARGDGWQLVKLPSSANAACGSTTVHISWPVNQEYVRNLPQPDGTVRPRIQIPGPRPVFEFKTQCWRLGRCRFWARRSQRDHVVPIPHATPQARRNKYWLCRESPLIGSW